MSDLQQDQLNQLRRALRALERSLGKAQMTGSYAGLGDPAAKNFQRLLARAQELLPDDFFVQSLALELPLGVDEEQKIIQVQFALNQLAHYIDSLFRDEQGWGVEFEGIRNMGTEIRDQIIAMTKTTLKNALANIDLGENPTPPRKVKVKVQPMDDEE